MSNKLHHPTFSSPNDNLKNSPKASITEAKFNSMKWSGSDEDVLKAETLQQFGHQLKFMLLCNMRTVLTGFSVNENLEGLLRGMWGVDSGGKRLGVNASGNGIWFNGLRGLVAISARWRRRLAGSSLLKSFISFPLLIGGGLRSDLMLGLMTRADGMDLDFDVRRTKRGFDTSLLRVVECEAENESGN